MIACIRHSLLCTGLGFMLSLAGCGESSPEMPQESEPVAIQATAADIRIRTPESLRRELNCYQAEFRMQGMQIVECSLFQTGQKDISALQGLQLKALDLGMTKVDDLSPLVGMPLQRLDLESTPVSNLEALRDMPLQVLKMQQTSVTDFQVLDGMPLQQLNVLDLPFRNEDLLYVAKAPLETLWLAGTQVTELARIPLDNLESLDIERTAVSRLDVLSTSPRLVRLNIAETKVTDLTPLRGLRLQRITLTPQTITTGMEYLRKMSTLQEIRTDLTVAQTADEFWKRYDLDLYQPIPPESDANPSADPDAKSESEANSETSPTPDATGSSTTAESAAGNDAGSTEEKSADEPASPNPG